MGRRKAQPKMGKAEIVAFILSVSVIIFGSGVIGFSIGDRYAREDVKKAFIVPLTIDAFWRAVVVPAGNITIGTVPGDNYLNATSGNTGVGVRHAGAHVLR